MTPIDFIQPIPPRRRITGRHLRIGLGLLGIGVLVALLFGRIGNATVSVVNRITRGNNLTANGSDRITPIDKDPEYAMPENSKKRLDILVLGIRGRDDVENGGLLTDTIVLFSLDTTSGKATMTSIPRDLMVRITDERSDKINGVYAHYGVNGSKKLFSRILGVAIDHVVVVDFAAFSTIVDTLGGVTVTLEKPFTETTQWGYEFSLPAGENTLTGEQALYYVRSRYGTSDFDRSRRQMQVLLAIKAKAAALDLTNDPIRAVQLASTVRKHVETDLNIFDIGTARDLLEQQESLGRIKRYQLTTENLLYETHRDGAYVLLPLGDTLSHIKEFFSTILTDAPVIWTPTPTPTASSTP
ncbi:MAG: LCP family protein [Candidatus Yanofskybacteria bacterium]|nr:LCP family protein [Candidatus Yanofskybacteria bacterium]